MSIMFGCKFYTSVESNSCDAAMAHLANSSFLDRTVLTYYSLRLLDVATFSTVNVQQAVTLCLAIYFINSKFT